MGIEQVKDEIDEIVKAILSAVPALEIYLFGSFANGTAREDSDLDFYVVIPDGGLHAIEATWAVESAIPRKIRGKIPIDMLVRPKSNFDKYKTSLSFVERDVSNKGVKLYG